MRGGSRRTNGVDLQTEEEVEEWKKKDPVANFEKKLMAQGILTISRRESPPFKGGMKGGHSRLDC